MRASLVFISVLFGLQICSAQVPANDSFAKRLALPGSNVSTNSNNLLATTEPGEPTGTENRRLEKSLWYSWKAPTYGTVRVLLDTTLGQQLSLYDGTQLAS